MRFSFCLFSLKSLSNLRSFPSIMNEADSERGAAKILIIPVVFADDKWRQNERSWRPRQKLMIPAAA